MDIAAVIVRSFALVFVPLFVAVDLLGLLPLYVGLTEGQTKKNKNRIIGQSMVTALSISIGFMILGKGIFLLLGIRVHDFLVAGGALLFVIAIRDILATEPKKINASSAFIGVVPIGMPLIAGPAVLTTTLILMDAHGILPTLAGLVLNILLVGFSFTVSDFFVARLGAAGLKAVSKLTSILLSAYAIMMVRRGVIEIIASYR